MNLLGGATGALSLSIEETNKLRAKLGLKPLQVATDFGASNQEQVSKIIHSGLVATFPKSYLYVADYH
jgi:hypothetical protein